MIKTAQSNILASSAVSLASGTENSAYPLTRLYDQNIGRMFRASAAETIEILIDQGVTPIAVDRLLIPDAHNLEGMPLDILYSDDDVTYTPAVAQFLGASGLINVTWSPITKRYWKFKITSPSVAPEFAELHLTSTYQWERMPMRPYGPFEDEQNIIKAANSSGSQRFLVRGAPKKRRVYNLRCALDMAQTIQTLYSAATPLWLYDHESQWIYGRLATGLNIKEIAHESFVLEFNFKEVLP